ncbi:elongator complex protein 2-like [Nannochloropsis oceanica]
MASTSTTTTSVGAESVFISAACNSFSQCLAWAKEVLPVDKEENTSLVVAYGAHEWVALATAEGEVRHSLRGHGGKVHCVAWLVPRQVLVSGAADGTVRIWEQNKNRSAWMCTEIIRPTKGETATASINRLAVLGGCLIAAVTTLSVTVWQCSHSRCTDSDSTWTEIFAVVLPPTQIPYAVALVPLSGQEDEGVEEDGIGEVALFVGAVDAKIHIWNGRVPRKMKQEEGGGGKSTSPDWKRAGSLVGHQDWVRSLAWRPLSRAHEDHLQHQEGFEKREQQQLQRGRAGDGGVWVASGAHDGRIRLWRIEPMEGSKALHAKVKETMRKAGGGEYNDEENNDDGEERVRVDEEADNDEVRLVIEGEQCKYGVRLDALLVGHTDWVTGLCWHPQSKHFLSQPQQQERQPLALLSCSMDRSLIIWRPEGARGVWTPRVRLGDLGADLGGAVGSNLLGFMGCVFSADGKKVLGHGFGGSFHAYEREGKGEGVREEGEEEEGEEEGRWVPGPFTTGHFEEVSDVQWERSGKGRGGGRYLVSVSKDQTTRLWARVVATQRWHEMSRVQVHGYDLTCLDLLPPRRAGREGIQGQEHRLISGADEKTLRVFDAPNKVLGLLEALGGIRSVQPARVETAYIPALALSSKAVQISSSTSSSSKVKVEEEELGGGGMILSTDGGAGTGKEDVEAIAKARARVSWEGRGKNPSLLESELVDHTLWPEIAKLYGHGNGIACLAADPTGRLVASACKARDAETAQVRLWDTGSWIGAGVLPGHESTVVQLAFSHDGLLLVSVSKDRQVCVYARARKGEGEEEGEEQSFQPVQTLSKSHKRIIWSCDWSHDDALLATASRDGVVKLWRRLVGKVEGGGGDRGGKHQLQPVLMPQAQASFKPSSNKTDAVTAVAFAPRLVEQVGRKEGVGEDESYILAIGMESGEVELWSGRKDDGTSWRCLMVFEGSLPHAAAVRRLRWKPLAFNADVAGAAGLNREKEGELLMLASCGADHAVKITRILNV